MKRPAKGLVQGEALVLEIIVGQVEWQVSTSFYYPNWAALELDPVLRGKLDMLLMLLAAHNNTANTPTKIPGVGSLIKFDNGAMRFRLYI